MKSYNNSAFPTGDHNNVQPEYGISKLEYFTGLAMQAIINRAPDGHLGNSKEGVVLAVQWAKDIITELEKPI